MRNVRAFTLAELLIGVTVSAIIMVGVSVFVGSGIENAFKIRKGMDDNRASADFDAALGQLVSQGGELLFSGAFDAPYGSGVLLKNANRPIPLAILTVKTATGICDAYSGTTDDPGIASRLAIIETFAPSGVQNAPWLTVDHTGHVVRDASNAIVLGTGNPGTGGGNGEAGTATELRYPSAVIDVGAGKYLVADSGNDRLLLFDGTSATTYVGADSGMRHPHAIATNGEDVRIAESGRVFGVLGNPPTNGSAFSGSFDSDVAFSFDTVTVTLGGGRIPPSDFTDYSFDFVPVTGSASVAGSTVTLTFSGSTPSYAVGSRAELNINDIPATVVSAGAYQASVRYLLSGVEKYRRVLPYFVTGDADPLTLSDNLFEVTATGAKYPGNLAFSSGTFSYSDLSSFAGIPNAAALSNVVTSTRMVEGFRTESDGRTLTVRFVEFVRYDCLGGNHVKRERVVKIPLGQ